LDQVLNKRSTATLQFGVHDAYSHEKLTFAKLAAINDHAPTVGPLQHEELEIGDGSPVRCLTTCLWLCEHNKERFAMLLSPATTYGRSSGLHIEIARMPGGKIDISRLQAIEFPLPDDDGRLKLIKLYAGNLEVSDKVARALVTKTRNSSAAFIKELMRRSAQNLVQADAGVKLTMPQVEAALDEMLFAGGSLNVKILGGASQEPQTPAE
jgi:hypothetical protein